MGTSQRLSKTQRHRYILFYKMYHFSYLLLLTCLGLAAAAPRKHGQDRHHGVQCRTEYTTLWDTEYQDIETHECVTKWVPVCETYTETECSTENREECEYTWEGEGDNVEWVVVPGTCELQPHDECVDVTKEKCEDEHKRIPVRVSKRVPKKVCDDVYADSHDNSEYEQTKDYDEDSSDEKKDRKKNKKHKKDSDEDSSDEKKDRKKNKKFFLKTQKKKKKKKKKK